MSLVIELRNALLLRRQLFIDGIPRCDRSTEAATAALLLSGESDRQTTHREVNISTIGHLTVS